MRLLLNGKVIGEKPMTRAGEFKATFTVPYAPGELKTVGLRDGREVETFVLKTAGEPATLRLTADRTKLRADGQDLAFVTVEALDQHGVWHPQASPVVTFAVDGPGSLAAVGTGDLTSMESYQANTRTLFQGRALAVVRTGDSGGSIKLTATAPGLHSGEVMLTTVLP